MIRYFSANREKLLWAGFCVCIVLLSFYVMAYSLGKSDMLREGPHHTTALLQIDGKAVRPYVYRVLLPTLSNVITSVTPKSIELAVNESVLSLFDIKTVKSFLHIAEWKNFAPAFSTQKYLFPIILIVLMMYGSIVAYGFLLFHISKASFPDRKYMHYATAIFGLFLLLPFITKYLKTYDPPTLLFAALCLFFMIKQRWQAYLIAYVFTCLNKETAILQTLLFFMAFKGRMPARQFIMLMVWQVIIFASIKLGISIIYADSPGNIMKYREIWAIAKVSRNVGGFHIMVVILLCWALFSQWCHIPHILRHGLWILAAGIPMYYLIGNPYEYRVFFDCFPALTVIAGYTLFRQIDSPYQKDKLS